MTRHVHGMAADDDTNDAARAGGASDSEDAGFEVQHGGASRGDRWSDAPAERPQANVWKLPARIRIWIERAKGGRDVAVMERELVTRAGKACIITFAMLCFVMAGKFPHSKGACVLHAQCASHV